VLHRAIPAFQQVSTLRAAFTQVVRDPMLGTTDTTRGELFQQRPNRFAMRFSRPAGDQLVVDGEYLWVYLPSSAPGQAIRSVVSGRPGHSPDVLHEFLEDPEQRFTVAFVRTEAASGRTADVLSFTPKQANTAYRRVLLWIDRVDALPRQVEVTEASGAVRRIALTRLTVNRPIAGSTFTFRPPPGVRVVDASP
jgi:outer membrane lipoprotein carrier protein